MASNDDSPPDPLRKKHVFVELIDGSANCPFELSFTNTPQSRKTDVDCIVEAMRRKKPGLGPILASGAFLIQKESEHRKDKWVTIGDNSPVKDMSDLRCVVTKCPVFEIDLNTLVMPSTSPILVTQSYVEESQTAETTNSAESSYVEEQSSSTPSGINYLYRCLCKLYYLSLMCLTENEEDLEQEEENAQAISSQVWPRSQKTAKFNHVHIDTAKFKLPTHFGSLNEKIKSLDETLKKNEYSSVCRALARSIEKQTIHPHPDSIRHVVGLFLAKYESLVLKKDIVLTTVG